MVTTTPVRPTLTTKQVAGLAGMTYRRADLLVRDGHLTPQNALDGSGTRRRWSPREMLIVRAVRIVTGLIIGDIDGSVPLCTLVEGVIKCDTHELTDPYARIPLGDRAFVQLDLSVQPDEKELQEFMFVNQYG